MKKNILLFLFFSMALISFNYSFAGPWGWVKNKVNSLWLTYERWGIPRPRLVNHQAADLDGKKFEQFQYDLSRDTDETRKLRKNLGISGIYFADGSDMALYAKLSRGTIVDEQYIENGFDAIQDNSVSACMARLFENTINRKVLHEAAAFMQLLWELEDCLPKDFDQDETGKMFIAFIYKMIEGDTKELVSDNRQNASQDFMSTFLAGIRETPDISENTISVTGQNIERYLSFWKQNTRRFYNNKGLQVAIDRIKQHYNL